jgi:hypothetical protein
MRTAALLAMTVALSAFAQTPGDRPGKVPDPLDAAKTSKFLDRYNDEMRAKKGIEAARAMLHTQKYKDALDSFEPGRLPELHVTSDRFITANATTFIALQLGLPAGIMREGQKVTAFGKVVDAGGRTSVDFEEGSTLVASKGDLFVERTLFPTYPTAMATFGIAVGDEIIALGRVKMDDADPAKGISQMLVSNNVHNLARQQSPFEPFAFGGTKVVPKPDHTFGTADEVWLFVEVRNPALGADRQPKLTMRVDIEGTGRKVTGSWLTAEAAPLKGVNGHYGVGTTLDVATLGPGAYKVRLALRDAAGNASYEREETITVK